MKTIATTTALLLLPFLYVHAQVTSCTNLINQYYTSTQIIKITNPGLNYARSGYVNNDVSYVSDSLGGNPCSAATTCVNGNAVLNYEVYYPNISYSDANKLPAFVMFHSGGFSDCSNTQNGAEQVCMQFAQRGYVAFNVEYRRGRNEDPQSKYTSASHWLALYRGVQDGKGALRTIVARENARSQPYRIDVSRIFVGGTSSGTDLALMVAYFTDEMMIKVFSGVAAVLGASNVNRYAGNASYTIRGVLDMWGGFPIPLAYVNNPADFIRLNPNIPPLIAFHGNADKEVNIVSKNKFFSEGTVYNSENLCTNNKTFALPANGKNVSDFKILGSQGLYDMLTTQIGVKCELYIDCNMGHGLEQGLSDFGLGTSVKNKDVQAYIVQRGATFFQYITNASFPSTLTHTRFVDCVNPRFGCNGDASTACSNTAICPATLNAIAATDNVVMKPEPNTMFSIMQYNRNIIVNLFGTGDASVNVYSVNGNRIQLQNTTGNTITLDCSAAPAGVYIVQVIKGSKVRNEKIVLQ
jgi:poly(3-hydroxybutyrate) depolymerase